MARFEQNLKRTLGKPFAVLLWILLGTVSAHGQLNCIEPFAEPSARTRINNEALESNTFRVDRSLRTYALHFPFKASASLNRILEQLPGGSIWVDMGAGEGRALIDGLVAYPQISEGIAIAYKKPPGALSGNEVPGRFRYLDGDYVENMAKDGKLDEFKGRVGLVTDVASPGSYSEHLPPVMQIDLDLLHTNGIALFNIIVERNFETISPTEVRLLLKPMMLNPVVMNGQYVRDGVVDWLRTIPGIEVVEVARNMAVGGPGAIYWEKSLAIKIRKTADHVVVPNTLKTIRYEASSPPKRVFEFVPD